MFIILIVQCLVILLLIIFLICLSLVSILYQNKICLSIKNEKFIYKNVNILSNLSTIDPRLKLNHFTILGSHNSYHIENFIYKYSHENLDKQLSFGLSQIELDIHLMENNYLVYHLQLFDDRTNCYCFNDCLNRIAKWMKINPSHYPIYLFIEIKQMFYEDLFTGLNGGVKCQHFQSLKEQILEIFSLDTFILPEEIQGNETSIKLALKKQREDELNGDYSYKNFGWPPISQSLGKLIPVFIDDKHNRIINLYPICDSIRDFFFISQTNIDLPYSSIINIFNPIKNEQILINNINNGQIIRLYLGYGVKHLINIYLKSKQYGIHIISSDSNNCNNTQLCISLTKDFQYSTILCNNYYAPTFCNSDDFNF